MYLFNKQGKVLGTAKNGKENQNSQTLGLTGMKVILSTCRNKSFFLWLALCSSSPSCPGGLLVREKLVLESTFLQNGSGSFGIDKVGSEIGVNEQLLLGRKEENKTVN